MEEALSCWLPQGSYADPGDNRHFPLSWARTSPPWGHLSLLCTKQVQPHDSLLPLDSQVRARHSPSIPPENTGPAFHLAPLKPPYSALGEESAPSCLPQASGDGERRAHRVLTILFREIPSFQSLVNLSFFHGLEMGAEPRLAAQLQASPLEVLHRGSSQRPPPRPPATT